MVWRTLGRTGLAARIREHMRLAQLFTDWIEADPRFELAAPTVMGVVCFRFIGGGDRKSDRLNEQLVQNINERGETYLMQTKLQGHSVMRLGLGNILTTEHNLRRVWEIIRTAADGV
jgi:aromatic-L-amino-acid decarboxylase